MHRLIDIGHRNRRGQSAKANRMGWKNSRWHIALQLGDAEAKARRCPGFWPASESGAVSAQSGTDSSVHGLRLWLRLFLAAAMVHGVPSPPLEPNLPPSLSGQSHCRTMRSSVITAQGGHLGLSNSTLSSTTLECIAHDKGVPLGTFFVQRGHCPYRHKHWHYSALALRQTLDHACHLRAF